jgi:Cytochrome bd terminal oxidase subunit I
MRQTRRFVAVVEGSIPELRRARKRLMPSEVNAGHEHGSGNWILIRCSFASAVAFVISFHIIFPAFTIGLAAWLATIEGARLFTGRSVYRRVFDFWLRVFALSFGMDVVSGIVWRSSSAQHLASP